MTKQAIVHVDNTENVVEFAKYLSESGWTVVSANKTEELLKKNRIPVLHERALVTDKTFKSDGTILIRRVLLSQYEKNEYEDEHFAEDNNIFLLCINITPSMHFSVNPQNKTEKKFFESFLLASILRSAYVNYKNVLILTDPNDYKEAIIQLKTDSITEDFRHYVAAKALNLVSAFDGGFSASLLQSGKYNVKYLDYLMYPFKKGQMLHSGSNPHQTACLYNSTNDESPLADFLKTPNMNLNYNDVSDIAMAYSQIVNLFATLKNQYTVKCINCDGYEFTSQFTPLSGTVFTIIIKFNSIVGASLSSNVLDSFRLSYSYDKESITAASLACSAVIDAEAAKEIATSNLSAIVAPSFTGKAKTILSKNKNLKLIPSTLFSNIPLTGSLINGGIILQQRDDTLFGKWTIKTKNRPSQIQSDQMAFSMLIAKGARSYSVVLLKDNAITGIAQACPSTLKAVKLALLEAKENRQKYGDSIQNLASILVCDGTICFNDDIKELIDLGLTAILQTGGSENDNEFIQYCDEKGIVMVFTDITHISL